MPGYAIRRPDTAFSNAPSKGQKRPRKENVDHLKWIRTLPCVITGKHPVEAAHIRYADPAYGKRETGKAEKPDDAFVVPLHPDLHREQHSMNEQVFWAKYRIDPIKVALALSHASGDDDQAKSILERSRA